jgi:single-strand DNA-binding protein
MNDTVTIMGRVGNDPSDGTTTTGVPVLNFRVGSSQRRFDQKSQSWIDTGTNWYSVAAYRQLAENARGCLRKGDPVIITGRLKVREWDNGNGTRGAALDIDAETIGHDLRWGSSAFVRVNRNQASQVPALRAVDESFTASSDDREDGFEDDVDDETEQSDLGRAWEAAGAAAN